MRIIIQDHEDAVALRVFLNDLMYIVPLNTEVICEMPNEYVTPRVNVHSYRKLYGARLHPKDTVADDQIEHSKSPVR